MALELPRDPRAEELVAAVVGGDVQLRRGGAHKGAENLSNAKVP